MLTTLVYRFGIPGGRYRHVAEVQANGQCFLARREVLDAVGGFAAVRESICEDITLARLLVEDGHEVGFFEAGDLVSVRMYPNWQATWRNWPRSLPMRDRYFGTRGVLGLAEVLFVQALPLPLLAFSWVTGAHGSSLARLNLILLITRFGILAGTARAYSHRPLTYWISPLADLPVALRLIASALQREHSWRGRVLVRGGSE
jgi:dolichol-phosphate mannosyltransferase